MSRIYKLSLSKLIKINIFIDLLVLLFGQVLCDYSSSFMFVLFIPDIVNLITFVIVIAINHCNYKFDNACSNILLIFVLYAFLTFFWSNDLLSNGIARFRYIVAGFWIFYCCVNYIDSEFIKKIINILFASLWIHTMLIFLQYFVLKAGIDASNGLFGFIEYNNAAQGIYCLAMALIGVISLLFNSMPKKKAVAMILLPCITCALSEIKAFYVEFIVAVIFLIFYCVNDKKTRNKILSIILIVAVGSVVAYKILELFMPDNLYAFKSLKSFLFYESYETKRAGGYGRYSQLQWVFDNVFSGNFIKSIFGMGITYRKDVITYEVSKSFANFGFIGLFLLLSFYFYNIAFFCSKKEKSPLIALSIAFSVVELLSLFMWNATLNRMSYLGFMIISFGYIDFKRKKF